MLYLVSMRCIIFSPLFVLELLQFLQNFTKLCKFKYVFSLKSLIKIKLNTYSFGKDLLIAAFCFRIPILPSESTQVQDRHSSWQSHILLSFLGVSIFNATCLKWAILASSVLLGHSVIIGTIRITVEHYYYFLEYGCPKMAEIMGW